MQPKRIFDIIGIGVGPFNLGLAALACSIPELQCLFLDQNEIFDWHPGLMLEDARLQVPFLADLVTLADPSSPFSYLCFLKSVNRLTRFAIHENYYPTRREYNEYCRWVIEQLPDMHFGTICHSISYDHDCYTVSTNNGLFHSKHIVIGTGTQPSIPNCVKQFVKPTPSPSGEGWGEGRGESVFHSSDYLFKKRKLFEIDKIAIIGSGQSAAEIFHDLLKDHTGRIDWFTRSERFYPMEYSKLTLEMSSPDYIDYFFKLPAASKQRALKNQNPLYKGINFSLVNAIYDQLYMRSLDGDTGPCLFTHCELQAIAENEPTPSSNKFSLKFYHSEENRYFEHLADAVILATGYQQQVPSFIEGIRNQINWTIDGYYAVSRNYSIDNNNTVFVQNADLQSHGFNSADLGLGAYRNGIILNTILKREHFVFEKNIVFQHFGSR
jgi:lysine N6-hydroxylase